MVLAERNSENVRNGRRSRGPSPNGHTSPPISSSDDENSSKKIGTKSSKTKTSEYEAEKIRVGRDYQAVCPELVPSPERKPDLLSDRALLVWSPTRDIPESKLEEYISVAKEKYGYNGEQALGMLFWHKHDLERAVLDLANFTPFPDEWTVEDKVLFEQAFQFHGKSFHRIRQMLPDKSIASLVKYYYSWKKTRNRTSVMDRKEQIKKNEGSENGSENGSNEDSDNEDKKWPLHRGIRRTSGGNDDSNSTSVPIIQIQNNRQLVSSLKRKNSDSSEDLRPMDNINRINSRWNSEELLLAVEGVRKYGKDFQAIAEAISTKSEAQVRTFFVNYRRRYNLDVVLREYELEHAQQQQQQQVDSTATISITTNNTSKTNGQTLQQKEPPQETEIMAIDLDEDSLPSSNTNIKDKDIEHLKSSADVSIIPVEKMDTTTTTATEHTSILKPLTATLSSSTTSSSLHNTTITSLSSEISIIPCGNNKTATLAK